VEVVLRPFRADEFERAWAAKRGLGRPGDRNARRRFRRRFDRSGAFHDRVLHLAIEADGRLVGDVQARQPKYCLPPGVFELGIELYDSADRGKGIGGAAVAQLTERLFREHGAGRVHASSSADNAAARRVFERLGFTAKGVTRGFWPRDDGPREDYVLYAITRSDWEARA
jgi:RimJ/RimL family protein N-acetyltransferase